MKFAFYTLGCKVNQYETQAMEQQVLAMGHTLGRFEEACDCYVINTCTVTAVADKKNRAVIRRCRRQNPRAIIGVCGCYAQMQPQQVRALDVDVISGSAGREAFIHRMLLSAKEKRRIEQVDPALQRRDFELLPAGGLETRTRAMLKVQDGCNNFCSYCIIPYARGPVRSAPLETAVAQGLTLAKAGYREIVVTGIEIASWGWDLKDRGNLTDLVESLCSALPEVRIRLGSLEPRVVTEEFCRRLSRFSNLCPQFHLSLQSGSDAVLTRMRRKYHTERYLQSVTLLRTFFPGCALTTDLIVGFPGETEAELSESLSFARQCRFAAMHVFPYSRRPGTPAAEMPGQLSKTEKEARSARALAVAAELEQAYLTEQVGKILEVLFEEPAGSGLYAGHAPNYAKVYAPGSNLHNVLRPVAITGMYQDGLLGEIWE